MTSYEFEVAAKNAIIKTEKDLGADHTIMQIHAVWMTHVLGNKKGIFICGRPDNRMYEVTYNASNGQMYVDCYQKRNKSILQQDDLEYQVRR